MSEELYNSNDFCKLAEEFEELKKENAELSRDKDRLMNLFMESSEYVFDTSANMKIESLTRKCKALEADYAVSNREMLLMQVEIGELESELARLNAERRWIPVSESFPEYGEPSLTIYHTKNATSQITIRCLVEDRDDKLRVIWYDIENGLWVNGNNITHWMPLPEPPKSEG